MNENDEKVKAIIFDCFGVLVSDRWLPFRQRHFGNNSDKLTQATELRKQADSAKITRDEFYQRVSGLAGMTKDEMVAEISSSPYVVNQDMLAYIAELKPGYKIGFLSNASQNWLSDFFTPDQITLFDAVSISCETGFVKPDPRAYQSIVSMLDIPTGQCLLIDDQSAYCEGARAIGMKVVQYTDLDKLKIDIQTILN